MTMPTPPGDMPLFEGLGTEWNDIVAGFPEEQRSELASKLKSRIDTYEPLKQWDSLQKSGVTPDHASTALNVFSLLETNPRQIYETIGNYLNITPQQAKEAVETLEETNNDNGVDPRLQTIEQQVQTLTQIALAQRQQSTQEKQILEQEAQLDKEITGLKAKYGDVDEEQILMRMLQKNITAEDAYKEYAAMVTQIRSKRPSPMLMGGGGNIPNRAIDPTKLDSAGTKNLVAQMMQHALDENRRA
jgi:hypothetical protein